MTVPFQGWCLVALGAFERAAQVLGDAISMSRRLGMRFAELFARHVMTTVVAHRGEGLSSLALLVEVQQGYAAIGTSLLEGIAETQLARGWLLSGDRDVALARAERAVALTAGAPPFHASALAVLAQAREKRGEQAEALGCARRAMAILDELGSIGPIEAAVRLAHVQTLHAAGDAEGARSALAKARDTLAAQAGKIRDPELRRSFLEENRSHRKILALAEQWLGPAGA
jgi:ATP/maltotriose-dependent transcriptional regulator MalT